MSDNADAIIEKWRQKIRDLQARLVAKHGQKLLDNGGFYYSVDEEDGFLESLSWVSSEYSDFKQSNEPLLKLLQYWSNDRECFPVEFVREMLKEALRK